VAHRLDRAEGPADEASGRLDDSNRNRTTPRGWKVFEAPGVEPVFQAKAIGVLQWFTASQLLPSGAPIRQGSRESQARRQLPDARTPRFGYSTVMLNVVSMVKLNSSNVPPIWIVWLPGLSGASIR
jgi:hypothetical protein